MNALGIKSGASPDLARAFLWGSLVFFCLLLFAQFGMRASRDEAAHRVDLSRLAAARLPAWAPPFWKDEIERTLRHAPRLSVFDDAVLSAASERISMLPFVESVDLVSRQFPRSLAAKVEVRRPLVLVRNAGRLYAVDRAGVLLPGKPEDARGGFAFPLPVLSGRRHSSLPSAWGETWNEEEIHEGVAIAMEIDPLLDWHPGFRIAGIDLSNLGGRVRPLESEIVLHTDRGVRILWGRSSRKKPYGELSPEAKLGNLQRALEQFPGLEGVAELDLRFDRPAIHVRRG